MPPKKKKKPDALGQPRAGMRDSAYELGGSGSGGGGYSPRRAPKLKPSSARPKLKPFQKPSKKLKLPPKWLPKKPPKGSLRERLKVDTGTLQVKIARTRREGLAAGRRASGATSPPPVKTPNPTTNPELFHPHPKPAPRLHDADFRPGGRANPKPKKKTKKKGK
jgi:hypothetical protein